MREGREAGSFTKIEIIIFVYSGLLVCSFLYLIFKSHFETWFDIYMTNSSIVITIASIILLGKKSRKMKFIMTVILMTESLVMLAISGSMAMKGWDNKSASQIISGICWAISMGSIFYSLIKNKES